MAESVEVEIRADTSRLVEGLERAQDSVERLAARSSLHVLAERQRASWRVRGVLFAGLPPALADGDVEWWRFFRKLPWFGVYRAMDGMVAMSAALRPLQEAAERASHHFEAFARAFDVPPPVPRVVCPTGLPCTGCRWCEGLHEELGS